MWELATNSTPKAKKEHICDECRKPIRAGDVYDRIDGKWEGEFASYKSHMDCSNLCRAIYANEDLYPEEFPRLEDCVFQREYQESYGKEYRQVFERFGIQVKETK